MTEVIIAALLTFPVGLGILVCRDVIADKL